MSSMIIIFIKSILVAVIVTGLLYIVYFQGAASKQNAKKRQKSISGNLNVKRIPASTSESALRKKQIAENIKNFDKRGRSKSFDLSGRLIQAGLSIETKTFFMICLSLGVAFAISGYSLTNHVAAILIGFFLGSFVLPNMYLQSARKRRIAKFADELPNAIDVIVRGLRSGIPLTTCLRTLVTDAKEPVRTEIRLVTEAQVMGIDLETAIMRMVERVPSSEANFFAIAIILQRKSGGNLSEAISNLARVLRERKKMKQKVHALSSESKSTTMMMGAMPFIMAIFMYFMAPKMIALLWTTNSGILMVVGTLFWMSIGLFIMKQVTSFEI